jgi:2-keto-4-pentenoate hydratase/2-oxohepta-3-ene-1,7-dioic acid hydratase in catechol pathway
MQLLTIDDVPGGSAGARLQTGSILHLGRAAREGTIEAWLPSGLIDILAGGDEALAIVRRIIDRAQDPSIAEELEQLGAILPSGTRLLAPVPRPPMIVAAGLAYRSHLAEMNGTDEPPHPTAFMKAPSSVAAPGATLRIPPQATEMVDYEGELALVFGRRCHMATPENAMSYIAGYTVANDLSARDWAKTVWAATKPWEARLTWEVNIMGKQLPGFTPLGPVLLTRDEVADPNTLRLITRVNGAVVQDSLVGDMIFPLEKVIAHLSHWYTFQPGDVLLTGTPAGVGIGRKPPLFLKDGDTVEVEIDAIGTLKTPVGPIARSSRA